jgi:site-specific DNA-methyltransferase (adenine-specific)
MKRRPGEVRDAIISSLANYPGGASVGEIESIVAGIVGEVAPSSVRSYLRLNTPGIFVRSGRGRYQLREEMLEPYVSPCESQTRAPPHFSHGQTILYNAECIDWLLHQPPNSIHAVVTDPPYGLIEYSPNQQEKLRNGKGGVWRIPPSFDGTQRAPLPRFTILTQANLESLHEFVFNWARALNPVLVPGANIVMASNPLLSSVVSNALAKAGMERRGELVRLVMTMRGGDRPKSAHVEFEGVSVMPRSMWEPWLVFRKPLDGRVQDNLRKWKTGGFRRPGPDKPFGDVIASAPTRKSERELAPHPSLKPQAFLRQIVRAVLPLGFGVVLDPFAGSGSTLAAANALDYRSIGIELDSKYFEMARSAIPRLADLRGGGRE